MADFIDFGKFAQTAIAFQNLQETVRRNDLGEENLKIHRQQLNLQEQQNQLELQRNKMQQFKSYYELANDPRVKMNPELNDAAMAQAWRAAGNPEVSPDFFKLGREHAMSLMTAQMNNDPEQATGAFIQLQILAGPDDAKKMQESVASFQKMREYSENVEAVRQMQAAKIEKIRDSMAKVNTGQVPLQMGVRDFTLALDGTDSKEFQRGLTLAESLKKNRTVSDARGFNALVGQGSTALEAFTGPKMEAQAKETGQKAAAYGQMVLESKQALQMVDAGEPLPKGLSKRDLVERVTVGQTMVDAYSDLAEWQRNPFDRAALKKAQAAKATILEEKKKLDGIKATANDDLIKLRQDALDFRMSEAGKKHFYDDNVRKAQAEVLGQYGFTPEAGQLAEVATKYGVKTSDILPGLADPSKKGKVEVGIVKMGQEDMSRQFKAIEAGQGVVDYVADLRERITANPAIIGRGAQLGTALAGAGQQLRAIVNADPDAAKFLNTKTRDEAEAFYEVLVYLQARSMDPSGPLDLKVVQHARDVLGDINSFTTGPKQMLNKLQVVQSNAERNIRRARQRLKGGADAYINEPAADKKVGDMTEEELMQAILGGRTP